MTQRQSLLVSRSLAFLLSAALIAPSASWGQSLNGNAQTDQANQQSSPKTDSTLAGRLDTTLSTPTIRQSKDGDDAVGSDLADSNNTSQARKPQPAVKPLPPNDFQKFVQENTGQSLPLFGYNFFSLQNTPYSPSANTPVSPDYRLGPGDELQIRGWGSIDIDVRAVINRDGQIHLPKVGPVTLAGVRSAQADDVVRAAVARYYKEFQLNVTQGRLRGMTIYVVGQARKPGAYSLSGASTLISALFASGGPNQNGSMRHVLVKRSEKVVADLDLYAFLSKGDKASDVKLQDGDTIVITAAKGYVALTGKVPTPAVYELSGDDTIDSLLAMAGGLPVTADPKRATLERVDPSQTPARSVDSFALSGEGLQRKLKSGDLLAISALAPEFGNTVTLRGNVGQPVRMPWKQGMTVRDLIPSKAYLVSQASLKRQNEVLLSEEDKKRLTEGFMLESDETKPKKVKQEQGKQSDQEALNFDNRAIKGKNEVRDSVETLAQRIGNLVDEINLDYAVIERVDNQNVSVKLLPFNLGQALENDRSPENLPLQAGDIVTVFSVNDVSVPQAKRQVYVRVEGEVKRPGIYQMTPGDSLPALIDKAGGLTEDAYLFGAAFYREQVRKAQLANLDQLVRKLEMQSQSKLSSSAASVSSLDGAAGAAQIRIQAEAQAQKQAVDRLRNLQPTGRIMLGLKPDGARVDALPSLRLESQDRLVVPARPDFVYVLGSVNTESSLIWKPGQTVHDYLDVSGLTSGADKDELFVIRADGSVLSNGDNWFGSVTRAVVQPGDLIVLPEKTDHESGWSVFTRNAKDITQIIYQFSLGAAAIKTLRQ